MPEVQFPEIPSVGPATRNLHGTHCYFGARVDSFGMKSRGGATVFFVLDASGEMLSDRMDGTEAYTLIKGELFRILRQLSPTVLFNIAVYDQNGTVLCFPRMLPASRARVDKAVEWLEPLNAGSQPSYGIATVGPGGSLVEGSAVRHMWSPGVFEAMKQQVESVYLLAGQWELPQYRPKGVPARDLAVREKWEKAYQKGLELMAEENRERHARGEWSLRIPKASYSQESVDDQRLLFSRD